MCKGPHDRPRRHLSGNPPGAGGRQSIRRQCIRLQGVSSRTSRQRRQPAYNPSRAHKAHTPRWRNWQTHYFEVVAPQGVQVQILSWALQSRGMTSRGLCLRRWIDQWFASKPFRAPRVDEPRTVFCEWVSFEKLSASPLSISGDPDSAERSAAADSPCAAGEIRHRPVHRGLLQIDVASQCRI